MQIECSMSSIEFTILRITVSRTLSRTNRTPSHFSNLHRNEPGYETNHSHKFRGIKLTPGLRLNAPSPRSQIYRPPPPPLPSSYPTQPLVRLRPVAVQLPAPMYLRTMDGIGDVGDGTGPVWDESPCGAPPPRPLARPLPPQGP
ncbi:hypothetical protein N657DRAFT_643287 [Parathielavia appendiculata]|uniref:Uncharacterized protein n=1 Tax=Parathielavia appendiculata TaxID=2587402 RepID=A0AAN6U4U4_9PEZI|nr:hypothetical protein N657DRAFT_643287 [Parathielavia appendiculata]